MARRRRQKKSSGIKPIVGVGILGAFAAASPLGPTLFALLLVVLAALLVVFLVWLVQKWLAKQKAEIVQSPPLATKQPVREPFDPTKPSIGELPPEAYQPPEMRERSYGRPTVGAHVANPPVREYVEKLDWFQFEKFVAALFRAGGCEVHLRGGAKADGGMDLLAVVEGVPCAVQCKHWTTWKCGVQTVRELLGTMAHEQVPQGYVIAKTFTHEAKLLADQHGIALVDRDRLVDWAVESWNFEEVRDALIDPPKLCPKCGSSMKLRTAGKGRRIGKQFWSCSKFRCSGAININDGK